MKLLIALGAAFGLSMLAMAVMTPTPKEEIMRMIEEEAARLGRTIDKQSLSAELDRFTPEQLVIFREYVRNIIARTPQTSYWIDKLRNSMEINKPFWKAYQGIIFGS